MKDAPAGRGFWHWVYNVPPSIFELKEVAGNFSQ
jgi:phosphatidylethanolamine-binding protein (PEBP) family uncharacterized protein